MCGRKARCPAATLLFIGAAIPVAGSLDDVIHLRGHPDGEFRIPHGELRTSVQPRSWAGLLGLDSSSARTGVASAQLQGLLERTSGNDLRAASAQLLVHAAVGSVGSLRELFDPELKHSLYIPPSAFALYTDDVHRTVAELESLDQVKWVGRMRGEWKHDPDFLGFIRDAEKRHAQESVLGELPNAQGDDELAFILSKIKVSSVALDIDFEMRGPARSRLQGEKPDFVLQKLRTIAALTTGPDASGVANDMNERFAQGISGRPVKFSAVGASKVVVSLLPRDIMPVVEVLRSDERVHWISPVLSKRAMNNAAAWTIQTGNISSPTKIWDNGVTGANQVIHIHDSGLDRTHCDFVPSPNAALTECTECDMNTYYSITTYESLAGQYKGLMCGAYSYLGQDFFDVQPTSSTSYCELPNNCASATTTNSNNLLHYWRIGAYFASNDASWLSATKSTLRSSISGVCTTSTSDYADTSQFYDFWCAIANGTTTSIADTALYWPMLFMGFSPTYFCPATAAAGGSPTVSSGSCTMTSSQCLSAQTDQPKVQGFWKMVDDKAVVGSHGTHVAGSAAGLSRSGYGDVNTHKGIAYNASIVFSDASSDGSSVITPPDLKELFQWGKNQGASISTNSWGGSTNAYNSDSQEIDEFAVQNPDHLILFAAGNSGTKGFKSLGPQSNAKNVLSVGATTQAMVHRNDTNDISAYVARYLWKNMICNVSRLKAYGNSVFNDINNKITGECSSSAYTFATPENMSAYYCPNITGSGWRSWACIVVGSGSTPCRDTALDNLKYILTTSASYSTVADFDAMCGNEKAATYASDKQNDLIGLRHMATFSSRGPTADGRIKPDLVAPGKFVVSDFADDNPGTEQCTVPTDTNSATDAPAVYEMAGTSMATPVAAGAAALVRQYYMEGFYVNGTKSLADSHTPSAALLRATLAIATVEVEGNGEYKYFTSSNAYNPSTCSSSSSVTNLCTQYRSLQSDTENKKYFAGHGALQLDKALAFTGDNFTTVQRDRVSIKANQDITLAFRIDTDGLPQSGSEFRVALAWTDPAGNPSTSGHQLVNNLDLVVDTDWAGQYTGNDDAMGDAANNLEVVKFSMQGNAGIKTASVKVSAVAINQGTSQNFSLAFAVPKYISINVTTSERSGGGGDDSDSGTLAIIISVVGALLFFGGGAFLLYIFCFRVSGPGPGPIEMPDVSGRAVAVTP